MPPKIKHPYYSDDYVDPPRPKPILSISPEGIEALRYEMFMPLPFPWKSIAYNSAENKGHTLFFYNPDTKESQKEIPLPKQMLVQPSPYPRWYRFGDFPERHQFKNTEEEYNEEILRLNEKLVSFYDYNNPHVNDPEYIADEQIEAFLQSENPFPEPEDVPYHRYRFDPNWGGTHVLAEQARRRLKGYPSSQVKSEQSEQSGTESDEEKNIIFFGDLGPYELYSDFNGTTP